jgi:SAM-dependent methyltransferase
MPTGERDTAEVNADFFAGGQHARDSARLDVFRLIWEAIDREIGGARRMLDVGNGGVFEYDTSLADEIVAVDLFLDRLPAEAFPANVTPQTGDALDLDQPDAGFDTVLQALLYHHLVGDHANDIIVNVRRAIAEAHRVLEPSGRLVVAESCVPAWFYAIERRLYPGLVRLARTPLMHGHPPVIQLPSERVVALVAERFSIETSYRVQPGRWTTQFGVRWPMALTPAHTYIVVGRKK